jgi:iron complex transport system substrate-binding protein
MGQSRPRWLYLGLWLFCLLLCLGLGARHLAPVVARSSDPLPTCRSITHAAGISCVPTAPQRVVTLDAASFENVLALGITPIGTVQVTQSERYRRQYAPSIAVVGGSETLSLEAVLALHPDLILGLEYHQSVYAQLAQIAPTVLLSFEASGEWQRLFQAYGQSLNRVEPAKQVLAAYQQRLEQFQQQHFTNVTTPLRVSVVRAYAGQPSLYLRDSFIGSILAAAGFARPGLQNLSAQQAQQRFGNQVQALISLEEIPQADADILFIWTSEHTIAATQVAQNYLKQMLDHPLWQSLQVVENQQVYQVPDYWIGTGPLAASAVLDDLGRFLLR